MVKHELTFFEDFTHLIYFNRLRNFGEAWGFHPSNRVLTFVENHDNGT